MKDNKIIWLGAVLILAILAAFMLLAVVGVMGYFTGNLFGGQNNSTAGDGGSGYSCAGVANVPSQDYPWVKDAADKWLKGDEAALIALIQIESGWNPQANAKGSSAAGLGQFITSTAKGYPEFTGGSDSAGTTWPAGQVFDPPEQHLTDDARFDPQRSIYAVAHKLSGHLQATGGDLEKAYESGYHGYCKDMSSTSCQNQFSEAQSGGARLMGVYNKIINGGGCTLKGGGSACGVIAVSEADATISAAHHELMPPAAGSFNQIAAEYHQKTGKKLNVTSMFRTQGEQEKLREQKPNLANEPGQSMHEAGLAIDINWKAMSDSEYTTFMQIANANQWQVANKAGRGAAESWHFDYAALKDKYWYGEPKITNAISAANSTNCGGQSESL